MKPACWIAALCLLAALGGGAWWYWYGRGGGQEKPEVLVFGIDGGSFYVAKPLLRMGRMPVFASLINQGYGGHLRSFDPLLSPIIWTSIVTGKTPKEHGVEDFVIKFPGSYYSIPISRLNRKVAALWNMFSVNGKTAGIVNWWATWPAEKISGYVITNNLFYVPLVEGGDPNALKGGLTFPAPLVDEILPSFGPSQVPELKRLVHWMTSYDELVTDIDTRGKTQEPLDPLSEAFEERLQVHMAQEFIRTELTSTDIVRNMLTRAPTDVVFHYLQGTDPAQHFFWKWMEPKTSQGAFHGVTASQVERLGKLIPRYYCFVDQQVGRVLDATPKEKTVFILSDHGFRADFWSPERAKIYKFNPLFEKLGWLAYQEGGEIDWSRTRVYTTEQSEFWFQYREVFLNLKGREPEGTVDPEIDIPLLIPMIKNTLAQVHTTAGQPIFLQITTPDADMLRRRGPAAPDLVMVVNPDLKNEDRVAINGQEYPITDFMLPRFTSGNHNYLATVIAAGTGISRGKPAQMPTVYDFAPTLLAVTGQPYAEDMKGRPWEWMMESPPSKEHPLPSIPSYEAFFQADSGDERDRTAIDEKIMETLKQIGYFK